jgi:hypothetical protein
MENYLVVFLLYVLGSKIKSCKKETVLIMNILVIKNPVLLGIAKHL